MLLEEKSSAGGLQNFIHSVVFIERVIMFAPNVRHTGVKKTLERLNNKFHWERIKITLLGYVRVALRE